MENIDNEFVSEKFSEKIENSGFRHHDGRCRQNANIIQFIIKPTAGWGNEKKIGEEDVEFHRNRFYLRAAHIDLILNISRLTLILRTNYLTRVTRSIELNWKQNVLLFTASPSCQWHATARTYITLCYALSARLGKTRLFDESDAFAWTPKTPKGNNRLTKIQTWGRIVLLLLRHSWNNECVQYAAENLFLSNIFSIVFLVSGSGLNWGYGPCVFQITL